MVKRAAVSAGRGELRRWAWVACCCATLAATAHAGAWNDRPAHGQLIMTTSLFRAWDQYGAKGQRSPFANAGRFQQIQFGNYLELGLSKRWTLALNLPISNLQYTDSFSQHESGALGDLEIGIRRRLNGLSSPWAVSGQFTVTVPGYKATLDPAPGNHQEDVEGRLLVGRGANWGERHWFWDGEAAYRYRTGAPADQLRGDFTAGVDLLSRVTLLGQFYSIKGLRNGAPLTAKSNPNAQSDFDLYKAQGSLVVGVRRSARVQLGWGTHAGRAQHGPGRRVRARILAELLKRFFRRILWQGMRAPGEHGSGHQPRRPELQVVSTRRPMRGQAWAPCLESNVCSWDKCCYARSCSLRGNSTKRWRASSNGDRGWATLCWRRAG